MAEILVCAVAITHRLTLTPLVFRTDGLVTLGVTLSTFPNDLTLVHTEYIRVFPNGCV